MMGVCSSYEANRVSNRQAVHLSHRTDRTFLQSLKVSFGKSDKKLIDLVSERKRGFFVKVKEDQNFNRRNIVNILRIKFLSDVEIGEKGSFRSDTTYRL